MEKAIVKIEIDLSQWDDIQSLHESEVRHEILDYLSDRVKSLIGKIEEIELK